MSMLPFTSFHDGVSYGTKALPAAISAVLSFGLFLGDWSNHLHAEWRLKRSARFFATHLYFAARCSGLVALICQVVLTAGVGHYCDCLAVFKTGTVFTCIGVGSAYALLTLRCAALWHFDRRITVSLFIICALVCSTYLSHIVVLSASPSPYAEDLCFMTGQVQSLAASYIGAALFDTLLAVLTVLPLMRSPDSLVRSDIGRRVVRGTAAYYSMVILLSISCGALLLSQQAPHISSILTPIHASITLSMACRVHLYLRDLADKRQHPASPRRIEVKKLDGMMSAVEGLSPQPSPVKSRKSSLRAPIAVAVLRRLSRHGAADLERATHTLAPHILAPLTLAPHIGSWEKRTWAMRSDSVMDAPARRSSHAFDPHLDLPFAAYPAQVVNTRECYSEMRASYRAMSCGESARRASIDAHPIRMQSESCSMVSPIDGHAIASLDVKSRASL
ncbi:hypothetical protein IE81DRAFT_368535 [Ceraceosorus guamensis]|uniref:Uncharacterized protein n=1 Tax=Ceraceosorus guamensis TaxID=1522189 RepID=A0A316VSU2_9BASI|nr:hypothetical protein IE81DRAFT_368535 [Ceraceosorus guamensis]PWN40108.1 hypothetical protein IE81DRAFT_368535 [Ceraceosorus guamensis]